MFLLHAVVACGSVHTVYIHNACMVRKKNKCFGRSSVIMGNTILTPVTDPNRLCVRLVLQRNRLLRVKPSRSGLPVVNTDDPLAAAAQQGVHHVDD